MLKPDKTLAFKGDKCQDGKKSKQRVTILFCTNMDGSEKLKPLVIGKSENPRCFKSINKADLPVTYRGNKSAWMTNTIFIDWLTGLNNKFKKESRNVILLIDNFSGHTLNNLQFSNIKIEYFPANTTSVLQPMDQGIIENFKCHYRYKILQKIISQIDMKEVVEEETYERCSLLH